MFNKKREEIEYELKKEREILKGVTKR